VPLERAGVHVRIVAIVRIDVRRRQLPALDVAVQAARVARLPAGRHSQAQNGTRVGPESIQRLHIQAG